MKTNRIITGDACQELPKLPDAAFQAIIADPPYYNVLTDEAWDTQWDSEEAYLREVRASLSKASQAH